MISIYIIMAMLACLSIINFFVKKYGFILTIFYILLLIVLFILTLYFEYNLFITAIFSVCMLGLLLIKQLIKGDMI